MSSVDPTTRDSARRRLGWLLTAVAVGLAGCGSNSLSSMKLYPVKGKVLLADGKPLTSGRIVFVAVKSTLTSAPSSIESDGTFTVKGSAGDGLPEGEYRIRIEAGESTGKGAASKQTPLLPFPAKYADEDTSDLKRTVKPEETGNNFEFKLTK